MATKQELYENAIVKWKDHMAYLVRDCVEYYYFDDYREMYELVWEDLILNSGDIEQAFEKLYSILLAASLFTTEELKKKNATQYQIWCTLNEIFIRNIKCEIKEKINENSSMA